MKNICNTFFRKVYFITSPKSEIRIPTYFPLLLNTNITGDYMSCMIEELQNKDVISIENGCKIGYVTDVEAEVCTGKISAIIVSSVQTGFTFKKPETFRVGWEDIVVMGDETILVKNISPCAPCKKTSAGIFNIFSK